MRNNQKYFLGEGFVKKNLPKFNTPRNENKLNLTLRQTLDKKIMLNEIAPAVAALGGRVAGAAAGSGTTAEVLAPELLGADPIKGLAKKPEGSGLQLPKTPISRVAEVGKEIVGSVLDSFKSGEKSVT